MVNITSLGLAYEEAYGSTGVYLLMGALSAHVPQDVLERLYRDAVEASSVKDSK